MYAILPGVATLGAAGLFTLFATHLTGRRPQAARVAASTGAALSWAASETTKRPAGLAVTRFAGDRSARRPGSHEQVTVRLDRLREALDQLTGLLLVGTSGEDGQARFLASLENSDGSIGREVAASALAMRRLGTLMLSVDGGETFLVARSAMVGPAGRDIRAIWEDFVAALAFLTGACQRSASTIHLNEVEATALSIERLCLSLSRTEPLAARLRADHRFASC
jgi:hypothetical protein